MLLSRAAATVFIAAILGGCAATKTHVVASTATVIGVELGQAPANTTPQAKLGYNRAEFAYVPTNRHEQTSSDGKVQTVQGAEQSAEVIMELRYGAILSTAGGIYQRLAVGKIAVTQPGAALMFAKDASGNLDASSATAVQGALAEIKTTPTAILIAAQPLNQAFVEFRAKNQKLDVFDAAAKVAGFATYPAFSAKVSSVDDVKTVRTELEKDAEIKTALEKHSVK